MLPCKGSAVPFEPQALILEQRKRFELLSQTWQARILDHTIRTLLKELLYTSLKEMQLVE